MDVLSDILHSFRLNGTVYFHYDFASPWGMNMDKSNLAQFHIVVRGQCWLQMAGPHEPISLVGGDVVAFPHGDAHWLADKAGRPGVPGKQVLEAYHNGTPMFQGETACTTLVCGHFELDRELEHPFLQNLPALIHVRGTDQHHVDWLENITALIIKETASGYPGAATVVDRLAEVLFVQLLRAYALEKKLSNGYLTALNNREIHQALQLIHAQPQHRWTLEELAHKVGLSRTSFAIRFKTLVGMTPMAYITNWRMQQAKKLVRESDLPAGTIAERVGYASEAAFSRAFKRQFNQNLGAMRRDFAGGKNA